MDQKSYQKMFDQIHMPAQRAGETAVMDSPSPLPSVLLATSPRIKRSVSSPASIFSGC